MRSVQQSSRSRTTGRRPGVAGPHRRAGRADCRGAEAAALDELRATVAELAAGRRPTRRLAEQLEELTAGSKRLPAPTRSRPFGTRSRRSPAGPLPIRRSPPASTSSRHARRDRGGPGRPRGAERLDPLQEAVDELSESRLARRHRCARRRPSRGRGGGSETAGCRRSSSTSSRSSRRRSSCSRGDTASPTTDAVLALRATIEDLAENAHRRSRARAPARQRRRSPGCTARARRGGRVEQCDETCSTTSSAVQDSATARQATRAGRHDRWIARVESSRRSRRRQATKDDIARSGELDAVAEPALTDSPQETARTPLGRAGVAERAGRARVAYRRPAPPSSPGGARLSRRPSSQLGSPHAEPSAPSPPSPKAKTPSRAPTATARCRVGARAPAHGRRADQHAPQRA